MAVLRSPEGCSWDRKQNHRSLIPYLIEECYEVVEAIERENDAELCEELGDLLCQIVFHAQLADESGSFSIDDSIKSIVDKLIIRHPHVFEVANDLNPQEVRNQWEKIKMEQGQCRNILSGLPASMPALTRAYRMGQKAGGAGFDWTSAEAVVEKLDEELSEIKSAFNAGDKAHLTEEIGDLLFAVASFARKLEIDPEQALKAGLRKFEIRFALLEERIKAKGKSFGDYDEESLDKIWRSLKQDR